jgi:hypothetical protein
VSLTHPVIYVSARVASPKYGYRFAAIAKNIVPCISG